MQATLLSQLTHIAKLKKGVAKPPVVGKIPLDARERTLRFLEPKKQSANQLAIRTGLSRTSVTNALKLLLEEKLVVLTKSQHPQSRSITHWYASPPKES
jgi:DNA-binding transcriptional ArsR family regulator